jgi:hypothetical protein
VTSFFTSLRDKLAVMMHGGVRVRVDAEGGAIVLGKTAGPPPMKIRSLVLELADGPGTVDVVNDGKRLRVTVSASAGGERLAQRLRNVLGNS